VAATVSWETLRDLAGFRATNGCVISFYVGLDPSVAPTAGDAATRVSSLLGEGERSHEASREDLSHEQRQGLKEDFERIRRYFDAEFDRDGAQGMAVFVDGRDDLWVTLRLNEPVRDRATVGRTCFLAPLVSLVGKGDGALVAFVGRERGDVYGLRDGSLRELADHTEEQPRRHDQGGWSQARFQRHIDNLAVEHMRAVADELDAQVRRAHGTSVVIFCAEEMRAEFEELLSQETRAAVAGWTQAEAHATPAELLELATPILEEHRARQEQDVLERWREETGRGGRAAAGWEDTLAAVSDARVDILLFQEEVDREAWQCPACGRASLAGGSCPLDGTELEHRPDGLDLAVRQTLVHGGTAWAVRHHQDLEPFEGIGALLRY
jgi:peptide chain release factor subunit 1